jgi:hypothetical protein
LMADLLTRGLSSSKTEYFCHKLNLVAWESCYVSPWLLIYDVIRLGGCVRLVIISSCLYQLVTFMDVIFPVMRALYVLLLCFGFVLSLYPFLFLQ